MNNEAIVHSSNMDMPKTRANYSTLIDKIPLIPLRKKPNGPLLRRRLNRFYFLQLLIVVAAMTPVFISASPAWKAFGLGIVWPGAGFLYAGGVLGLIFGVLAFAAFLASLFYWWARGIILLPPAVLLAGAALSGVYIGDGAGWQWVEWFAPAGLAAFHGYLFLRRKKQFVVGLEKAKAMTAELANVKPLLRDSPVAIRPAMTDPQVAEFRRMLDLALQPVDQWQGFSFHDKWQQDSLRYQICTPTWNLAMIQYSQLPSFHGYLNRAQENLIRKHIDRKTWDYWRYESLWGNFSYQKDPIAIDNIMLSGFLGVSLGMFETASGSSLFKAPGSLTFRWDESTAFEYSHSTLCETLIKNFKRYDIGWFPCEPRWVYSMCNLVGFNALLFHDKRHGTHYADQVADRFYDTMENEMLLSDGRLRVCTSTPFGFSVPTLSGLFGEAWGIRFLTTFTPEKAERLWEVLKRQFISIDAKGNIEYKLMEFGWDTRQPSDFRRWADINPLVVTLWAATEMGDQQVIDGISRKMDEKYGEGMAQALTFGTTNTLRDMVNKGLPEAIGRGPVLKDAVYPEVIVTHAVSDGESLDLVLLPGQGAVTTTLTLGRLNPGRRYAVQQTGIEFQVAADGAATVELNLDAKQTLKIVPLG